MNRQKTTIIIVCAVALAALWTAVPLSAATGDGGDVLCVRGLQNDAVVMAGTARSGVYRSTDGGATWMQSGLRTGEVRALAVDPRNASHVYAGTSRGVYASTDTGRTWWPVDPSTRALALAVSFTSPRVVLVTDGSAVRRTTDDGKSWDRIAPLAGYGIHLLASVRSDSGSVFFAACDSVVFVTGEKNQAVWTRLPGLPMNGPLAAHITAIAVDTLSRGGMTLAAGTTEGVFLYSFSGGTWQHLTNGLAAGAITSMDVIVYDTTLASRSYSLCASVAADPSNSSALGCVYKVSSVAGALDASSAWKLIDEEQAGIRASFAPDRGANRGKIYLATSDGLRISYDGGTTWTRRALTAYPIAAPTAVSYNAGIVGVHSLEYITVRVANPGENVLKLRARIADGAENFTLQMPGDTVSAAGGDTCLIRVQFHPSGQGKYSGRLEIETNDPITPLFPVVLEGFCAGYGMLHRTAVIDRAHGGVWHARYTELAKALRLAGMSVIDTLPSAFSPDIAMIILPGPEAGFTASECAVIAQCASAGASVVALSGASEASRTALNDLLQSTGWNPKEKLSGLPFRIAPVRVTAAAGCFDATKSFALRSASYLGRSATFRFSSSWQLTRSGGDTLFTAEGLALTGGGNVQTDASAMVGGVARTGSGKVMVIGDAGFWASDTGAGADGLWAADNFAAVLSIAGTVENANIGLNAKTADEQYSLISIPYPPAENAIGSIFRNLGEPNPLKWRLFGAWNEQTQSYGEYPSPSVMSIDRGKAYWLITKGGHEITSDAADYSLNPEPFTMTLHPGFTLIGDPFLLPVEWTSSASGTGVEGVLWSYNGREFIPTDLMLPFNGYFVCNPGDSDVVVQIRPDWNIHTTYGKRSAEQAAASVPLHAGRAAQQAEGEWSLHISASDGTVNDGENFCGMLRSASDARDANDLAEPPEPPGRSVSFRFIKSGAAALAGDFKSVHADGAVWECEVRASEPAARVTVQLTPETPLPDGCGIWVFDPVEERVIECSAGMAYEIRFARDERARGLRIIAGGKDFVGQHTDGVPLTPLSYALEQNFPNPWNPATTIRFTLAHSAETRLEIFDLLGRRVRTLVRGALSIGPHAEEWDGRDDGGMQAASGVYIYRLTTPAFIQSRRMVLLR